MVETAIERHGSGAGEWIIPAVSYVEPKRRFCAFCGRPIARRYWRAAPAGAPLPFCEPAHAELYVTYSIELEGLPKSRHDPGA